MRILLVDDSRVMRQIVARTLRQAGCTGVDLVEAGDGVEGLAAVTRHEPDLVLADSDLPQLDGIELLTTLRSRGDDTPVGFITSDGSPELVRRAHGAGALFVLRKPVTADGLRGALAPVLR